VWNAAESRVEMHLVSLAEQTVHVRAADLVVSFRAGEWIWTESSYKYTAEQIVEMGARAGFVTDDQWVDHDARFALTMFVRV
jgi:uncharacterized SAM-dependent methyltransferase